MYHRKIESDGLTYAPAAPVGTAAGTARRESDVVKRYLPLVQKLAWHVHGGNSSIDVEDLIQIGLIALVEASRVFEEKGASFSTYATTRVRGAMIDQLRKAATVSRRGMVNRRMIEAARTKLENARGQSVGHAELADYMGLPIEDYYEKLESARPMMTDSLEDQYSDSNMFFADLSEAAGSDLEKAELASQLEEAIGGLNEREAMILQLYFIEQQNLSEIAATLDIGSARVCQIKKRALEKLRDHMAALQG